MHEMSSYLSAISLSFMSLFPILNPVGHAPMFYVMTGECTPKERQRQAWKTAVNSTLILLVSLLAGKYILLFFDITLDMLRIAGGLLVASTGWNMIGNEPRITDKEHEEAKQMRDISFVPMALPILSGPGAIGLAIGITAYGTAPTHMLGYSTGIILLGVLTWVCFIFAEKLVRLLGETGVGALNRVLGLIIMTIGVGLIANGAVNMLKNQNL